MAFVGDQMWHERFCIVGMDRDGDGAAALDDSLLASMRLVLLGSRPAPSQAQQLLHYTCSCCHSTRAHRPSAGAKRTAKCTAKCTALHDARAARETCSSTLSTLWWTHADGHLHSAHHRTLTSVVSIDPTPHHDCALAATGSRSRDRSSGHDDVEQPVRALLLGRDEDRLAHLLALQVALHGW
jgi:hypothetical protein